MSDDWREDWPDYMIRATRWCEDIAGKIGHVNWTTQFWRRKWGFAGTVATLGDMKWSRRLLQWEPWFGTEAYRSVGRPVKRWRDDIVSLVGEDWPTITRDTDLWKCLRDGYVSKL